MLHGNTLATRATRVTGSVDGSWHLKVTFDICRLLTLWMTSMLSIAGVTPAQPFVTNMTATPPGAAPKICVMELWRHIRFHTPWSGWWQQSSVLFCCKDWDYTTSLPGGKFSWARVRPTCWVRYVWLPVCVRTRAIDRDLIEICHDLVNISRDMISTNHITENWSRSNWHRYAIISNDIPRNWSRCWRRTDTNYIFDASLNVRIWAP